MIPHTACRPQRWRRRDVIGLLGGALACPFPARAQQQLPVIGYLYTGAAETSTSLTAAFRKGLGEAGFAEGRNVTIEYRFALNDDTRLPELAADLVRRRVTVIVAPGSPAGVLAAKSATGTIPIVFRTGVDPVEAGFVASLNRPGGNVTGVNTMASELGAKQLGLLHELVPKARRFALLINPGNPKSETWSNDLRVAAASFGGEIDILDAGTEREIDTAFAALVKNRADALVVSPDGLFNNRRIQVAMLAMRYAVPAIYAIPEAAEIGGLMGYGASANDQFRQAGIYTGRVLKGEKPADMPVLRATTFEFVINLQTARTLGIEVPATLVARADKVIE